MNTRNKIMEKFKLIKLNIKKHVKSLTPYIVVFGIIIVGSSYFTYTPGQSYKGPIVSDNKKVDILKNHIVQLTEGEHNTLVPQALEKSKKYIVDNIKSKGYEATLQSFTAHNVKVSNIEVLIPGEVEESVVIGAHYDSAHGTPGANDNASGVAVLLELLEDFKKPYYTMRVVFFVNEEPPYFRSKWMGSYVYAKNIFDNNIKVKAMYSFDMLGAFYEEKYTQSYPPPFSLFYPSTANFVGFISNMKSKKLMHESLDKFRLSGARIGSEGIAAPSIIRGIDFSVHWSFYQFNYPAIMITDTSFNRYAHYHKESDTVDKINFTAMNEVYNGLKIMFHELYIVESNPKKF